MKKERGNHPHKSPSAALISQSPELRARDGQGAGSGSARTRRTQLRFKRVAGGETSASPSAGEEPGSWWRMGCWKDWRADSLKTA